MTPAYFFVFIVFAALCYQQVTRNQSPSFFIATGDKVKVDTSEARYVQRAQ